MCHRKLGHVLLLVVLLMWYACRCHDMDATTTTAATATSHHWIAREEGGVHPQLEVLQGGVWHCQVTWRCLRKAVLHESKGRGLRWSDSGLCCGLVLLWF